MDLINRIRHLLGGNKTQKRKLFDSEESDFDGNEVKKRRPTLQNGLDQIDHRRINSQALTNEFINMTSYNSQKNFDGSTFLKANSIQNRKFDNGGQSAITSLVEGYSPDFSQTLTNGKRKVPDLIGVRSTSNDVNTFNGPRQTVQPIFDSYGRNERDQFRSVPSLYPIASSKNTDLSRTNLSSIMNGTHQSTSSIHPFINTSIVSNPRNDTRHNRKWNNNNEGGSGQSSFKNTSSNKNSWFSSKNTLQNFSKQTANINTELSIYKKWLAKIVPGYDMLRKSLDDTSPETDAVINGTSEGTSGKDDCGSSTLSNTANRSAIEPVNSLQTRFMTNPLYRKDWEKDLNDKYSGLSLNRAAEIAAEEKKSSSAQQKTREIENKYNESMRKLSISSLYPYDIEEEEEPVNDYPELDTEKQSYVMRWISGRDGATVLSSKFNLSITRFDIQTLNWNPLTWLNDEVINFYMELLGERSRQNDNLPSVHAMNTFFLPRLLEHGYSGVRRWTRKVDIFSFDVLPIPVHKGIHWCMAIIHMKNKTIKYYDSMGAPNNQALNALSEYLKSESLDKKKTAFDMTGWTFENVRNIPQQQNGSDCGVFSCMYAEFITRNRPIVFSQQHMQYFRMKMIYEICSGKLLN